MPMNPIIIHNINSRKKKNISPSQWQLTLPIGVTFPMFQKKIQLWKLGNDQKFLDLLPIGKVVKLPSLDPWFHSAPLRDWECVEISELLPWSTRWKFPQFAICVEDNFTTDHVSLSCEMGISWESFHARTCFTVASSFVHWMYCGAVCNPRTSVQRSPPVLHFADLWRPDSWSKLPELQTRHPLDFTEEVPDISVVCVGRERAGVRVLPQ